MAKCRIGMYLTRFVAALSLALVILILPVSATPAYGSDAPSVPRQTVRVGFFEFDGYHMIADDGTRSGYGYELICDLARYNNWNVEYVGYDKSWAEMQQMLADGEIDMLTSAQKTPAREEMFDFSQENVGTSLTMLTVKSGDDRYTAGDYTTYNGMRVGMLMNNTRNTDFDQFASEKGFTYAPVYFDTIDELVDALQDGRMIDAALTSSLRSTKGEWILDEFNASPFYVMVRKGDSALLEQIDDAITQMDLDNSGWRTDLSNRYYSIELGDRLAFNADERDYRHAIEDEGIVFKVAMNPDNAPYSFFEDDEAQGIFPTVFSEIARRAGITYEVIPCKDRAEYEALVASGDVDIVMDSTASLSPAENLGYKLDDPYLTLTMSRVTRRSFDGTVATVCLPQDVFDAIEEHGLTTADEEVRFIVKDSVQDCIDAVLGGSCDAAYLYTYTARSYIASDESNRMTQILLPGYSTDVALAVSSRLDSRLFTILDKSSHSVNDYASETMLTKGSMLSERKATLVTMFYDHPFAVVGGVIAIALLIFMLVIFALRSRAAKRDHEKRLELERSETALSDALITAQRANEAKSTFLSSMSHDMRTPLNGILGFTDLALTTDDDTQRLEYLEKIQMSGNLMLGIVNDTLDLSRIESGKMVLEPTVVEAAHITETLRNAVRFPAESRRITLTMDVDDKAFGTVRVDVVRLQQIYLNLLSNAIKYTPAGGSVRLEVKYLEEPIEGCNCLTRVIDNGIGMSEEFLPHLFEAFSQEQAKEAGNVGGTGLGLNIVKGIVDLMDGHIYVTSAKGKGTTFTVLLPIELVRGQAAESAATVEPQLDLSGRRALLCEDNYLNAEIAETLLKSRGMEVVHVSDGREGLATFEASAVGSFDIILMDLRMPVMDGYATATAIRALDRADAKKVPILAMSADAYLDDVKHCVEVGMNGHVSKPVDPNKLFAEIGRVCTACTK